MASPPRSHAPLLQSEPHEFYFFLIWSEAAFSNVEVVMHLMAAGHLRFASRPLAAVIWKYSLSALEAVLAFPITSPLPPTIPPPP